MALALQMFSAIQHHDLAAPEAVSVTEERWAWVALALVREVCGNARRYHDLLRLGPPAEVLRMPRRQLAGAVGEQATAAVEAFDWRRAAHEQAAAAAGCGARLLVLDDAAYPASLRPIDLPPPFLLVRGALVREDGLAMAIVGSRQASAYGLRMAEELGADLGARGVTVVSGLARGIDTAAHRGALAESGRTIAVLGSGVDRVYPPENRRLAAQILESGALVSQFPMGTPPLPHHFPARNRVIAGLTVGTVVVEAAERSGALITARCAGELGREVYAVPGNVSSSGSHGTNGLIQDGAKLVQGWEDVVAEWPSDWRRALRTPPLRPAHGGETNAVEPGERAILAMLGDDPVAVDAVVERSGLPSSQVSAGLTALELRGLVRRMTGQRYVRS
ncbi:MAG TPA: DNA-processing protein DprA [Methylomirabilota bacterium]|jgi:DNA processing protein|nr:DNA-processing protein DprA [Methylomirabilota bacterium]